MNETKQETPAATTPPAQPQRTKTGWQEMVLCEVADARNRYRMFNPRGVPLRSRWSRNHLLPNELVESIIDFPDIPGQFVLVDGGKRLCRIFDPLDLEENSEFWHGLKDTVKSRFNREERPEYEINVENASPTDIKTWLYWLHRWYEGDPVEQKQQDKRTWATALGSVTGKNGRQAVVIVRQGKMPSLEEIMAMDGKIGISQHDSNHYKDRFLEDSRVFKHGLAGAM